MPTNRPKVGLLYDSVSNNTGDIAIGIALKQALSEYKFDIDILNPFDYNPSIYSTIIVGGGQLLRDPGDKFYDNFRAKGSFILNSVGISGTKAFGYLKDYQYLSARSTYESRIIENSINKKVLTVPCTTTILASKKYEIKNLNLKPGEKVVGIHVIPDALIKCPDLIEIINKIPHKKVFIPFTHYNYDQSFMTHMPFDKSNSIILDKLSPLELHSVISQMNYVIVSSLHASIFAYSQNVPFISLYQKKVYDYFKDRGLENYVYKNQQELVKLIEKIESNPPDMQGIIKKDKKAVEKTISKFAQIVNSAHIETNNLKSTGDVPGENRIEKLQLEKEQARLVIEKRDVLVHDVIYKYVKLHDQTVSLWRSETERLQGLLEQEKNKSFKRRIKRILNKTQKIYKNLLR